MIKKLAWNTFKNTGDINTYLELSQVINIEKNMSEVNSLENNRVIKAEIYGDNKNEGNNNFGECFK